jgi:flagellar basal-body rod protein FlgF
VKDLWVSISGALAQQKKVETIANNVANANTPGFKKDDLAFKEELAVLNRGYTDIDLPNKEWAPEDFYRSYGAENSHVGIQGTYTNHKQGQLRPTKNPLDLALNGPGFFEVLTPGGVRFTRRGTFTINNDGKLVTDQGHPVLTKFQMPQGLKLKELAAQGSKIPQPNERLVDMNAKGQITVNNFGEVFRGDQQIAELSVVEFKDLHALRKEGSSYYINANIGNMKGETGNTTVQQGYVEQSNVNAIQEMSELIRAHRHFESIQRVIKAYDNVVGREVNDIAKF